jgi:hypothetical protein
MENKLKHLDFIQAVISRMGSNSFLVKGWAVTLVAALFALAAKDSNVRFIYVAYLPVLAFWFLDTFFLRQEKLYRNLYNSVRVKPPEQIDFDLDASQSSSEKTCFIGVFFSRTLTWFHGSILIVVGIVTYVLQKG